MPDSLQSSELLLPLLALGCVCWLVTLSSWVKGLQLLVVVMAFGGIIGARLGATPLPIIFRDAAIVLPLYMAFFFGRSGRDALGRLPPDLLLGLCVFLGWLVICLFNPNGVSGLRLLIGLKVWAFYIPLIVVGVALAARPDALFRTLRALLLCGLVACGVGLLQSLLIRLIGYQAAIDLFFGGAGKAVTQGFSAFYVGGGIYRIPGTFSFTSQYVGFVFLFLTVAVIVSNNDPDPRFQRLGRIAFYVGFLAGLFSGTKGAFLMFPLYGLAFAGFGLIRSRLLIAAPVAIGVGVAALSAAGLDPLGLASFGVQQAEMYGQGFIFQQIEEGVRHGALGDGIGSSTSAARFGAFGADSLTRLGFESYFGKAAAELGTVGLVVLCVLVLIIATRVGFLALRHFGHETNRLIAPLAIYIAYVLVGSLKGSPMDTDPGNAFFWLSVGLAVAMQARGQQAIVPVGRLTPQVAADKSNA